jgi:hypothetical protein
MTTTIKITVTAISIPKKIQSISLHVFLSGSFILSFVHIYTIKPTTTLTKIVSKTFSNFIFEDSGYEEEFCLVFFLAIVKILYKISNVF